MLKKFQSNIEMVYLKHEILPLTKQTDAGNVWMVFEQYRPIAESKEILDKLPYVRKAIREIEDFLSVPAFSVMLNVLEPYTSSPVHTDPNPHNTIRYHLAVQTTHDNLIYWWDEQNGVQYFPEGVWVGPVPHTVQHKVANDSGIQRIHLIVDLAATI